MKCTKCGADIKKGNLYCSNCGTEVQIVSAYNVMEDEFFLDFQHRASEEGSGESQEESGEQPELSYEMPRALRKKNFCINMLVATLGFFVLFFCAFFFVGKEGKAEGAEQDGYEQAMEALSQDDFVKAQKAFASAQKKQPDELSYYFWQAWLAGRQEDVDRRKETLKQILALDKENIYACKELIGLYVEQRDFEALHVLMDVYEDSRLSALFADYRVKSPELELFADPLQQGDVLTITAADGLNIYYTLDGTSPVTDGTLYYAPIYLDAGIYTVQAAACNEEGYYSPVVSQEVSVEVAYQLDMPRVTPDGGQFLSPQTIYVSVPEGCHAYYTWDRSDPTTASRLYSGGIAMPEGNNVLSVILVDEYGNTSSVQRVNYIYMP